MTTGRTLRVLIQPDELEAEARAAEAEAREREHTPAHVALYHAEGRPLTPGGRRAWAHYNEHPESNRVWFFYRDLKNAIALLERAGVLGER